MNLKLPDRTKVDKVVSKKIFIEKTSKGRSVFTDIEKIIWSYKLASSTINIDGTDNVEEIQVFSVTLKSNEIPKKALIEIKKVIPYPILFLFRYKEHFCFGISLLKENHYYFSNWDEEKEFNFNDTNLEKVYQNLVKQFLTNIDTNTTKAIDFKQSIEIDSRVENINKQINTLKGKISREKQFNKKTELNKKLKQLKQDLEALKGQ